VRETGTIVHEREEVIQLAPFAARGKMYS